MRNYLLKGDISGIQDFIFNIKRKGAAKTLKARSYYIQIIGELVSRFVLAHLQDGKMFYNGGGSFFIDFQAETDEEANQQVNQVRNILNAEQVHDDLFITLAHVPLTPDNFGETWTALRKTSNKEKQRAFRDDLSFFKPFQRSEIQESASGVEMPQALERLLKRLQHNQVESSNVFKELTDLMVKRGQLYVQKLGGAFSEGEANFESSLVNKLPFWCNYEHIEAYKQYRKTRNTSYSADDPIQEINYNIIDFDALGDFAAHRTGSNKIAILKLDVDNLGQLFGSFESRTAVKAYSRFFSDFFSIDLFKSLYEKGRFGFNDQKETYRGNIYPVYAGGDDCFIIGGWDAILCFAHELHQLFQTNLANAIANQQLENSGRPITISAGITIVNPTFPVNAFSDLAESALSRAKANETKNAISLFDLRFSWKEYGSILSISAQLTKEMEDQGISRAFLDKIRKSARGFNALQNKDGADFDRIYKLKYYLSKNEQRLGSITQLLFNPYYDALKEQLLNNDRQDLNVAIYPSVARITELLTKNKLDYAQP